MSGRRVIRVDADALALEGDVEVAGDALLSARAFAIGHHHIYSALARGMPPPASTPSTFVEILERVWWKLDRALDHDMIRASALVTGIAAARSGCAFIVDHHSSPNAAAGSLDVIAAALDEVGIGHLLCLELSDRDGPDRLEAGFRETARYLAARPGLVGLHASFTLTDATLERAAALAREHETGVHIHVAEAESDQQHCVANHGVRVVERLDRFGLLEMPKTLLVHALHLDDRERAILAERPCWIAQCSESNQNNAVGRFDPRGLSDRIILGTDGMHSDPIRSARAAYLDGQTTGGLAPDAAWRRLQRVNAYLDAFGLALDEDDVLELDYPERCPTPITSGNLAGHTMYGLVGSDVRSLIRGGRYIMRDRELPRLDEEKILADARHQAERLWDRLSEA